MFKLLFLFILSALSGLASAQSIKGSYILEQNDCLSLEPGTVVNVRFNTKAVTLSRASISGEVLVDQFYVGEKKVPLNFGALKYVGEFTENKSVFTSRQFQVNATDADRLTMTVKLTKTHSGLVLSKETVGEPVLECVFSDI